MSEQKCAVITGGSSGIGQGIAIIMAEHGYDIAITYGKNQEGANFTKTKVEELGRKCFIYNAIMEEADAAEKAVEKAYNDLGRIDVMVNNAGKTVHHSVLTITAEEIDYLYSLNFRSYILGAKAAARHMVKDNIKGSIFFISSSRSQRGYPEDLIYGGLKAAINRACESMALDLSPYGIRTICIAPGATSIRERQNNAPPSPFAETIPLKRFGTPRENGELIAFLASDKAEYITGVTIRIDGGLILPGLPENWTQGVWLNPQWTKKHYDKMIEQDNDK